MREFTYAEFAERPNMIVSLPGGSQEWYRTGRSSVTIRLEVQLESSLVTLTEARVMWEKAVGVCTE